MEKALRDSENRYRTLVQQASEAIFIADDKGHYIDANARAGMREISAAMLASLGYTVETAGDGGAAVELFAKQSESGQRFCAVLLDLTVAGGMGGKETAQELRRLDSGIPLFVTSGYAEDPVMANPAAYGFKGSLRKPFVKSDLSELLEEHLKSDSA